MPYLGEIVAMFIVSVLIAYVCHRIRLVPIVGFLLAGVVVGPHALGLIEDRTLVTNMAEVGVILLLFTIGVELSLEKVLRIRRFILLGGGLQSGVLVLLVLVLLLVLGISWRIALFTGFLVVLSSTAIVLKLFTDRAETDTLTGHVTLALLIFQDLAMVGMVLLVPTLSQEGGGWFHVLIALLKAGLIILVVLVLARQAIPWLLEKVAQTRGQELFLLTVVTICFGTAWFTSLAGVSLALGAFLAGLVVSESRYRGYALSEILPLRTIFNAVFFVSIGMLLDVRFLAEHFVLIGMIALGVMLLKSIVTTGVVLALGYPVRIAAVAGLSLAQICETSFVLERAGAAAGLSPAGLGYEGEQAFIAVTVLLMMLTPFLIQNAPRVGALLEKTPLGRRRAWEEQVAPDAVAHLENHVVVVGYGPAGQRLVQVLQAVGVPFIIIEMNTRSVAALERSGLPALYGDASRPHILEIAGIERAKLCAVVINDPGAAHRIVELAHFMNPTLQIITRARFLTDVPKFQQAGADTVVPEELETSIRIFSHVLGAYMIPQEEINRHVRTVRSQADQALHGHEPDTQIKVLQGLGREGLHTRTVTVWPGALAAGQTLAELALRQAHGLTVLAVRRANRTIGSPAGDFRLAPGDRLVLVGTAEQFKKSGHLFRKPAADMDRRRA